ncbi:MAG: HD domain-containing protein [Ignavibacteriales bacterium]|nr:HD domain-containing protein [Ignavibacteriales bacterium]
MKKSRVKIENDLLGRIGALADEAEIPAFVVGGYVRDLLLGREVKDMDILVLGQGIAFAERVAKALHRTNLATFPKFGTAMLQLDDGKIEFVGARKESYTKDSRKPVVETGTLDEDLSRRDFTVNAVAVSLNRETWGDVTDPFKGREDLKKKLLRTPLDPEETFDDDPLRVMRAMRFAAQLDFEVAPAILRAARTMRQRLSIVSQERISEEILKLMASRRPSVGWKLMQETGVVEIVFPEIHQLSGVEQRKEYHHKDVFFHTLKVVDNICEMTENVWLRMAALLHDVAKPKTKAFKEGTGWTFHGHEEIGARMVKPIFRRMKFPLEHVPYVEKLVRLHLRPMALVDHDVTDSAVRRLLFEAGPDIDDLMTLCRADITSRNPKLVKQVRQNYDRVAEKMKVVEERDRMRNWQPALRGDEIMRVCGIQEGPSVGDLKQMVVDAVLDGHIPNEHDAALEYLLRIKDEVLSKKGTKSSTTRK